MCKMFTHGFGKAVFKDDGGRFPVYEGIEAGVEWASLAIGPDDHRYNVPNGPSTLLLRPGGFPNQV